MGEFAIIEVIYIRIFISLSFESDVIEDLRKAVYEKKSHAY